MSETRMCPQCGWKYDPQQYAGVCSDADILVPWHFDTPKAERIGSTKPCLGSKQFSRYDNDQSPLWKIQPSQREADEKRRMLNDAVRMVMRFRNRTDLTVYDSAAMFLAEHYLVEHAGEST